VAPDQFHPAPHAGEPPLTVAGTATVDGVTVASAGGPPDGARRRINPLDEAAKYAADTPPHVEPPKQRARAAVTVDRTVVDGSELAEAQRREAQARADLQSLWEEFNHLKQRHDEADTELRAVTQRETQVRAQLADAMRAIAEHESAAEQLRRVVAERDQEVHGLRQRLTAVEEARAADAAAFIRQDRDMATKLAAAVESDSQVRAQLTKTMSVIATHESAAEQLHLVISARDQEINELRQRLLDAEEARVTDAAAFLESLSKHQG
jgi:chromosome segregation ATPase